MCVRMEDFFLFYCINFVQVVLLFLLFIKIYAYCKERVRNVTLKLAIMKLGLIICGRFIKLTKTKGNW